MIFFVKQISRICQLYSSKAIYERKKNLCLLCAEKYVESRHSIILLPKNDLLVEMLSLCYNNFKA